MITTHINVFNKLIHVLIGYESADFMQFKKVSSDKLFCTIHCETIYSELVLIIEPISTQCLATLTYFNKLFCIYTTLI